MSAYLQAPAHIAAEAAGLTPADFEGVDGVLLGAWLMDRDSVSLGRTVQIGWGYIYGDRKGRFEDGAYIHTSYFTAEPVDGVYKTLNSTYRLRLRPETADDADA
ncbi:hypothetical protein PAPPERLAPAPP_04530 [Brevundimonas phage vB_BpoS-Papperlapapp]|uniref:Uncharacterized protein n=2 Tax=Marchewkavirus TaxID=3425052 RepID=A0A9E7SLT7_9CAUD|nr:hypothetical protein KABACHOK_02910 [Brevundimonas phage vB_BpoS-Kabachok]USN14822.1 hypothetical protein DOMOVOI_03480 [Brevundimonas phage vB_BpoS-Domovoi]USN16194.1 hypothetical protein PAPPERLAPAPP_04530 [Brevundimonas phage vB_BpoS-Papperlapapp]